jgi:hypothetical protein
MFLTADELIELTGRRRHDAQALALRSMGIEHRLRPDGTVVVLRAHVEQLLGVVAAREPSSAHGTEEPDWSAMNERREPRSTRKKPAPQRS